MLSYGYPPTTPRIALRLVLHPPDSYLQAPLEWIAEKAPLNGLRHALEPVKAAYPLQTDVGKLWLCADT
jgi:hypothetical protein